MLEKSVGLRSSLLWLPKTLIIPPYSLGTVRPKPKDGTSFIITDPKSEMKVVERRKSSSRGTFKGGDCSREWALIVGCPQIWQGGALVASKRLNTYLWSSYTGWLLLLFFPWGSLHFFSWQIKKRERSVNWTALKTINKLEMNLFVKYKL